MLARRSSWLFIFTLWFIPYPEGIELGSWENFRLVFEFLGTNVRQLVLMFKRKIGELPLLKGRFI